MFGVLSLTGVTGKYFENKVFFEKDPESSVLVARCSNNNGRCIFVFGKPRSLCDVKVRAMDVPVECSQRDTWISRTQEIVSPKENPCHIHNPPPALHVNSQLATLDFVAYSIRVDISRAEFEYLHIRNSPASIQGLAQKHLKLCSDLIREGAHASKLPSVGVEPGLTTSKHCQLPVRRDM